VAATGGESVPVTKLDAGKGESSHRFPQFLPDGEHFIYLSRGIVSGGNTLWAGSLDGGEPRLLIRSESQVAYAAGHLLFVRGGTLMAQPLDLKNLSTAGEAMPVAEGVHSLLGASRSVFSVSGTGVLVFQPGSASAAASRLVMLDRTGKEIRVLAELRASANAPAVSPDGRTIAVEDVAGASERLAIWTLDMTRGARARLTTSEATEVGPRFSPRGDSILFASSRGGLLGLYLKTLDRAADEQPLLKPGVTGYSPDWSPDGRYLLYTVRDPKSLEDLWVAPSDGSSDPKPYIGSSISETGGRFSPDGRWVAYTSGGGERYQVTVTSFPEPGRHWQVSVDGGTAPCWRRDGKEIFFKSLDNRLMAVDFSSPGGEVGIGVPYFLFSLPSFFQFDVMPDGKEIVAVVPPPEGTVVPLTVVSDWTAALEKK
jgi:dipeptidyl aminopeptidase/acylaminoacyl peptidase